MLEAKKHHVWSVRHTRILKSVRSRLGIVSWDEGRRPLSGGGVGGTVTSLRSRPYKFVRQVGNGRPWDIQQLLLNHLEMAERE